MSSWIKAGTQKLWTFFTSIFQRRQRHKFNRLSPEEAARLRRDIHEVIELTSRDGDELVKMHREVIEAYKRCIVIEDPRQAEDRWRIESGRLQTSGVIEDLGDFERGESEEDQADEIDEDGIIESGSSDGTEDELSMDEAIRSVEKLLTGSDADDSDGDKMTSEEERPASPPQTGTSQKIIALAATIKVPATGWLGGPPPPGFFKKKEAAKEEETDEVMSSPPKRGDDEIETVVASPVAVRRTAVPRRRPPTLATNP